MTSSQCQRDAQAVVAEIWSRHPALAQVAVAFPALAPGSPPGIDALRAMLHSMGVGVELMTKIDRAQSYEEHISCGRLPTRPDHWHDVFNAVAFASFPLAKRRLHGAVLHEQRQRRREQITRRTRVEDTLTLLDEATLLICCAPPAKQQVVDCRASGDIAELSKVLKNVAAKIGVLGHALHEHLIFERPEVGAGGWVLAVESCPVCGQICFDAVDRQLAREIASGQFQTPCFGPSIPWSSPLTDHWMRDLPLQRCRPTVPV